MSDPAVGRWVRWDEVQDDTQKLMLVVRDVELVLVEFLPKDVERLSHEPKGQNQPDLKDRRQARPGPNAPSNGVSPKRGENDKTTREFVLAQGAFSLSAPPPILFFVRHLYFPSCERNVSRLLHVCELVVPSGGSE